MKAPALTMTMVLAALTLSMGTYAGEKQEAEKKQTHCPVMTKNPINPKMYVDVQGKRIYVCCAGCIGKIKADPDQYIKQMEAEGIMLEKAPKKEEHKKESGEKADHSGHQH